MLQNLPEPVAAYFTADRHDGEAVARCFTRDAVVKDEGHTHVGHDAIKQWKDEASRKYSYTSDLVAVSRDNGITVVTARLTGNFPGSPTDLRFAFRLERGKIASLEVKP